jgi:hypothetical protein
VRKLQKVRNVAQTKNVKRMPSSLNQSKGPSPLPISPALFKTVESPEKENLITDEGDEHSTVNVVELSAQKMTITKIRGISLN